MTTYYLHKGYSVQKFKEICKAVELSYPEYKKEKLLVDVDNSLIQVYINGEKEIVIDNCAGTDVIEARADIDLAAFEYVEAIYENGKLTYIQHF